MVRSPQTGLACTFLVDLHRIDRLCIRTVDSTSFVVSGDLGPSIRQEKNDWMKRILSTPARSGQPHMDVRRDSPLRVHA